LNGDVSRGVAYVHFILKLRMSSLTTSADASRFTIGFTVWRARAKIANISFSVMSVDCPSAFSSDFVFWALVEVVRVGV
jgi:hypothetical protein